MPDMRHRTARKVTAASNSCLMTFFLLPFYLALAPAILVARAVKRHRRAVTSKTAGWDV